MKKIIIGIIIFNILNNIAFCADSSALGESSDVFNKGFSDQKQISDSVFKKTVKMLKERALTSKQKKIRKQVQPLSPLADEEYLKNFVNSQDPDNDLSQTLTVMIPVRAYSEEGKYIQPGYYKLSCRKSDNNSYVMELSQGSTKVLTVRANQTKQDLEQETIQFCNAQVIPNGRIRLMYGSIDLNLVAYLYYD